MNVAPLRRLQALEERRRHLFERVEGLDPDFLNRRLGESRWSIIQVMCHLIRAEELSLSYIQKKVSRPDGLPDVTVSGWLRVLWLATALRSPVRVKAPAAADVPEREDPTETRRRWDEVRSQWRALVERFPLELERKGVFRHPYAGRMTLAQALAFTAEHVRHHEKQIEAIRRAKS